MKKRNVIFGVGGFGREVLSCMLDSYKGTGIDISKTTVFMDEDPKWINQTINGLKVISKEEFNVKNDELIIAVGDPKTRQKIANSFPKETTYFSIIHPSAIISPWTKIGKGAIITAGTIITCNIEIGDHCHLNLNTTIGHDCKIGNYFTTAPGVNISGNCIIEDNVYFGTASAIRQGINVVNNVTIGMGCMVVKNIVESGVYIGNPAKKLK
ncbi:serine O-acetyltransferase [Marivirga tractuosa]|uniref:Sugar O-acyltransferase, sialic acid O-acetyltransferase NeuD family n=1 Tax=Marivirga tractuosa (strain ATCC 23168 / DSM 4126 / NBRC 15989 / NCIMB 1408 / VKM B-1430 / H-43) TaxID=643867 RepID=E4TQ24_MARTH|nr:acetyltransferase [Marivirga tractuosa]ADR20581.1 sugar O-acyltransferase, sialic acid O-acetyltransferase NeuD family [Marivirga tractuosa DSM 4126]BDD14971.1 serine O-acetyltransferase [Marivirga tractuosa]